MDVVDKYGPGQGDGDQNQPRRLGLLTVVILAKSIVSMEDRQNLISRKELAYLSRQVLQALLTRADWQHSWGPKNLRVKSSSMGSLNMMVDGRIIDSAC